MRPYDLRSDFDFQRGRITLPRYPFPARKTRVLERDDIVELIDWFPPAILTTTGEFLLIGRDQLAEIERFCAQHDVPFVKRRDVWSDLLEPFLDTEHSEDWRAGTARTLREAGFDEAEVAAIRVRVRRRMERLVSATWEWQHLGLHDVLVAMKHPIPFLRRGWRTFYDDAMKITHRGRLMTEKNN